MSSSFIVTIGGPTEIKATLLFGKDSVFNKTCVTMSDQKKVQQKKVVLPLNSRRLKLYQLQQLAQALELPIEAPSNDLRVMVEEKLRVMERDTLNTQVVVNLQEEGTENLSFQDEEGQFLHIFPQFSLLVVVNQSFMYLLPMGLSFHGVLKRRLRKWSYNNHFQKILD